jgi:hypothetical protein
MSNPLIFISHKHSDRAVATVLRSFVSEQSSGKFRVFQSSDPSAAGPRIARQIRTELREALWEASAVILVYTSPDKDWGYCMWECGVATHPGSPDTRIIVFQCADSSPDLFAGQLHVDARENADIERFARQFMTDPEFLPRRNEPVTGYPATDPRVTMAANKLFEDLKAVLPQGAAEEWPAHPFIQFHLSSTALKRISETEPTQRGNVAKQTVRNQATVGDADKVAESLFGMADFEPGLTLDRLFEIWRAAHPNDSDAWLDGLADQIGRAAQWQSPTLKWIAMPASGERLYAPVVTRVRKVPSTGVLEFDVYWYPFNVLEATPVTARMVPRQEMFFRLIEVEGGEQQVRIVDLLRELEEKRFRRVPFLTSDDRLKYMAHRSMLDQFITRQISKGNLSGLADLTLADVLREQPELRTVFAQAAAFVNSRATLGDAKSAMVRNGECRDVFVTANGDSDEPILGYVTDDLINVFNPASTRAQRG